MKYKVGDRVKIKSLDWYNENKNEMNPTIACYCGQETVIEDIITITIKDKGQRYVVKLGNHGKMYITDEMIEGLVEEETKPLTYEETVEIIEAMQGIGDSWECPHGYQFKDENGNVINATKIVLEKKKKEYPKTYEECCKVLGIDEYDLVQDYRVGKIRNIQSERIEKLNILNKLLICRDAYWKIAGGEMGLGKPWEPDWLDDSKIKCGLRVCRGSIQVYDSAVWGVLLSFPTEEMRDVFYENFKELIESVKELL